MPPGARDPFTGACLEAILSENLHHPYIVATLGWRTVAGSDRVPRPRFGLVGHTLSRSGSGGSGRSGGGPEGGGPDAELREDAGEKEEQTWIGEARWVGGGRRRAIEGQKHFCWHAAGATGCRSPGEQTTHQALGGCAQPPKLCHRYSGCEPPCSLKPLHPSTPVLEYCDKGCLQVCWPGGPWAASALPQGLRQHFVPARYLLWCRCPAFQAPQWIPSPGSRSWDARDNDQLRTQPLLPRRHPRPSPARRRTPAHCPSGRH
jgi:hypothetical protein